MVHVLGPKDQKKTRELTKSGVHVIDTTSNSSEPWTRGLSPFHIGPVSLYDSYVARNVENGWQYAKVYAEHVGSDGKPNDAYWQWAQEGWRARRARRYPMGKGAIPEYSYWDGHALGYVEARKKIYFPLYANTVRKTAAFKKLRQLYELHGEVYLWDYDGYDHIDLGIPLRDVINIEDRKMGHAFVLAMLLESGKG
jgi:hypothetical protein